MPKRRRAPTLPLRYHGRHPQIQVHAWRSGDGITIAVRTVAKRTQAFINGQYIVLPRRGALALASTLQRLCAQRADERATMARTVPR